MAWCNDPDDDEERGNELISPTIITHKPNNTEIKPNQEEIRNITCPSCGHSIEFQHQGLPVGMKFDPNDQEILEHLEAKVVSDLRKLHPFIDEFIPTLEGDNGICYTHPEKLPGVSKDGQIRHFFHRPSKAYTTGTRKRRKVIHSTDDEEGSETRWHKTGKTRPILVNGDVKGFKKILVLYTNYGRQKKPEKTNWVMHQYHLGSTEDEKDGEFVVSKVFYQTQPRHCGNNNNDTIVIKDPYDESIMSKNAVPLDYYNNAHNNYMNYEHHHVGHDDRNKESLSHKLLIPNLVVQDDDGGSSFFGFAMDHGNNKARLERK